MRKIICFTCVFILLLFLPLQLLHVMAATQEGVTDYSHLEPDENGKYWVYWEFENDAVVWNNTTHSVDIGVWVDVTEQYLTYGHPGLMMRYADNWVICDYGCANSTTWNTSALVNSQYATVKVKGFYDGFEINAIYSDVWARYATSVPWLINGSGSDSLKGVYAESYHFIPVEHYSYYDQNADDLAKIRDYEYLQDAPVVKVPKPQEAVFEFNEAFNQVHGLDMILRYPYKSSGDYYSNTNRLDCIPLISQVPMELVDTYVDYRLTVLVNGDSITTNWVPAGSLSYEMEWRSIGHALDSPPIGVGLNFMRYVWGWYDFSISKEGFSTSYLSMNLEDLPDFLREQGIHVSDNDTVILCRIEAITQNYHSGLDLWSDQVYSSFDLNTYNHVTDVIPVTEGTGHTVVNNVDEAGNITITLQNQITIPETVPTYSPTTSDVNVNVIIPGVHGDGSPSGGGSSGGGGFGDTIKSFFDFLLDILDMILNGLIRLGRLFFTLIDDIIAMVGEVPSLFSFIFGSLPMEFTTLFTLGMAVAIIMRIIGK